MARGWHSCAAPRQQSRHPSRARVTSPDYPVLHVSVKGATQSYAKSQHSKVGDSLSGVRGLVTALDFRGCSAADPKLRQVVALQSARRLLWSAVTGHRFGFPGLFGGRSKATPSRSTPKWATASLECGDWSPLWISEAVRGWDQSHAAATGFGLACLLRWVMLYGDSSTPNSEGVLNGAYPGPNRQRKHFANRGQSPPC